MTGWRLEAIVGEAFRSISASWIRSLVVLGVAFLMTLALTVSELASADRIQAFMQATEEAGANVIVATNEKQLSAAKCAALESHPNVVAAMALARGPVIKPANAPGIRFQSGVVTTGARRFFNASIDGRPRKGLLVGSAAAAELGLAESMYFSSPTTGVVNVAGVVNTSHRNAAIDRWILVVTAPTGQTDQCWVEFTQAAFPYGFDILANTFKDSGDQLIIRPLLRFDEFARNPQEELDSRPQAQGWVPVGLVLVGLAWLVAWFRRSEIALYRVTGTRSVSLLVLGTVELALLLSFGMALGVLWGAALWAGIAASQSVPLDHITIAVRNVGSAYLLAIGLGSLPWLIIARRGIASGLKDR